MKCPVCQTVDLNIAERSGIEIDYCPSCRGIWLDRGELDKLIDRASAYVAPPADAVPPRKRKRDEYIHDDHGDGYYEERDGYPSRRKSRKREFFDDLFDIPLLIH